MSLTLAEKISMQRAAQAEEDARIAGLRPPPKPKPKPPRAPVLSEIGYRRRDMAIFKAEMEGVPRAEIATQFGISRERVKQIVKRIQTQGTRCRLRYRAAHIQAAVVASRSSGGRLGLHEWTPEMQHWELQEFYADV